MASRTEIDELSEAVASREDAKYPTKNATRCWHLTRVWTGAEWRVSIGSMTGDSRTFAVARPKTDEAKLAIEDLLREVIEETNRKREESEIRSR